MTTRRPVQTLKKVTRDEADCALIDDAQRSALGKIDGGDAVKVIWESGKLPPMVVVAFSGVPGGERSLFKTNLSGICLGAGKAACDKAGIKSLRPSGEGAYAKLVTSYGG